MTAVNPTKLKLSSGDGGKNNEVTWSVSVFVEKAMADKYSCFIK